MNLLKKPFDDVRVRRAIYHAIDRKALVENFWIGASVARGVMPPVMLGFHDGLKWPEYDPEKARALLREAGLGSGFRTALSVAEGSRTHTPDPEKAVQAIQADLAMTFRNCGLSLTMDGIKSRPGRLRSPDGLTGSGVDMRANTQSISSVACCGAPNVRPIL